MERTGKIENQTKMPYWKWIMEVRGFRFFDTKLNRDLEKWEVWAHIQNDERSKVHTKNGNHDRFRRIKADSYYHFQKEAA